MRRGLLQDYANTLRDIAEGWRLLDDLELLLELGAGTIEIDVLAARRSTTASRSPGTGSPAN